MSGIKIGSNIASLQAQRRLSEATSIVSSVYEKLSSGQRINRASDDAAGLSIAAQLNVDSRIFSQAIRNLNDGVSYLGIAEGAFSEISSIITRSIELAEQSATGSYSNRQRQALDNELQQLALEHTRILESTKFNGRRILQPAAQAEELRLQAGIGEAGSISLLISAEGPGGISGGAAQIQWDGTFGAEFTATYPGFEAAFTAADFNNDGITDVVTTSTGAGSLGYFNLMLGNSDGTYQAPYSALAGYNSNDSLDFANSYDLNNDGNLDLVITNASGFVDQHGVAVLLGNGNGTFGDRQYIIGINTSGAEHVAFGDFNEDNNPDILIQRQNGATGIALGNGDGTFGAPTSLIPNLVSDVQDILVGDFDDDGNLDIANMASSIVLIQLGIGDGTFASAVTVTTNIYSSNTIAPGVLGDFNGDSIIDIAAASNDFPDVAMSILFGNGDGTFNQGISNQTSVGYNMGVHDINGDGLDDILTYSTIELSNGDGTFDSIAVPFTESQRFVFFGNINEDSVPDIIGGGAGDFANILSNTVTSESSEVSSISINLTTVESAREALTALNVQLATVSQTLGQIGAFQSRINVAINYLQDARINYKAAEGRIMDTDVAAESASLARTQILQQAASSVLAQANQQPQLALRLLA